MISKIISMMELSASLLSQVFRLLSLWFNLSTNSRVVDAMLETVKKVYLPVLVNVNCYTAILDFLNMTCTFLVEISI